MVPGEPQCERCEKSHRQSGTRRQHASRRPGGCAIPRREGRKGRLLQRVGRDARTRPLTGVQALLRDARAVGKADGVCLDVGCQYADEGRCRRNERDGDRRESAEWNAAHWCGA